MTPIQIILILIIAYILSRTFLRLRNKDINVREFWLWAVFWLLVLSIVIFPDVTNMVANKVGVGRGADLITALAIITVLYAIFKIFIRLEKIEHDITELVRKLCKKQE